jgi:predicted N-acyltransferase
LEIDTSKHTSIITQNIHKFYISLETLDDIWAAKCLKKDFMRVIEHVMPLERGRERLTRGESPGKPGP